MSEIILEVENLVKDFGSFRAVDKISFSLSRGKVIGLLGPNGAGKTTTIQMLMGITSQTSGSIKYFGKEFKTYRQGSLQRINFISSFNTLQGRISPWENLVVFAHLYSVQNYKKKIYDLAKYFGAEDILHKRYLDLSSGQKTRINIIKALLNDPELLLMDEPTASLDPDIADRTLTFIEELIQERNVSILFTSHDMAEVARICDEVIFLDHGKIVASDAPATLTKDFGNVVIEVTIKDGREKIEEHLKKQKHIYKFLTSRTFSVEVSEKEISQTIAEIHKTGVIVLDLEIKKPTLEDVFLQIARKESTHVTT